MRSRCFSSPIQPLVVPRNRRVYLGHGRFGMEFGHFRADYLGIFLLRMREALHSNGVVCFSVTGDSERFLGLVASHTWNQQNLGLRFSFLLVCLKLVCEWVMA